MSPDRTNTMWFWLFLVALLVAIAYGVVAYPHIDECGTNAPRTWIWFPPHYRCGYGG